MARHRYDRLYCVTLTAEEQDFVAHLHELAGLHGQADLLRLALWHLAKHYDVPIGSGIFALAKRGLSRRPPRQEIA